MTPRRVRLAFGRTGLELAVPTGVDVLTPRPRAPLRDPAAALRRAMLAPTSGRPLPDLARRGSTVAVSTCDVTRPFPARTVLPVLIDLLPGRAIRLLVATGTHRACTGAELEAMLGRDVMAACEIVQHDADDGAAHLTLGTVPGSDVPARVDRRFLEADARVTLGFVEPHFFAGFSGGPKMVAPGLADLDTIRELHSAARIASPRATWAVLEGNPVHDPIRAIAGRARVSFALDVALDDENRIAAVFSGQLDAEHRAACEHVRRTAMVGVPEPYDIVVTTNSGYPLDQNLYQCVKGMRAAAGVVRDGGMIILAAACEDGLPSHGRYAELLDRFSGPGAFLAALSRGEVGERDQWQVQVQAEIQARAQVLAYAPGVAPDDLRRAWIEPVDDVESALRDAMATAGPGARAAILPMGPQTIAYLAGSGN
jgi:nickel-dependent lactate racemase